MAIWRHWGKKTSQLSIFLPQGICQLLNKHIAHTYTQMCTHNNQGSEIQQRVPLWTKSYKRIGMSHNDREIKISIQCLSEKKVLRNSWCPRNEGKLETDRLQWHRMIHSYLIQSFYWCSRSIYILLHKTFSIQLKITMYVRKQDQMTDN